MGLKQWRSSAGLTQVELARLAEISRASVSWIETGRKQPSPGLAGKVCKALSRRLGSPVYTWDVFPEFFPPLPVGSQRRGRYRPSGQRAGQPNFSRARVN